MRVSLYGHLQDLTVSFHDRWGSGQLLSRAMTDLNFLRRWMAFGAIMLVVTTLTVVIGVVVMFSMSWQLALIFLAAAVPIMIYGFRFRTTLQQGGPPEPGPGRRPRHHRGGIGARHPCPESLRPQPRSPGELQRTGRGTPADRDRQSQAPGRLQHGGHPAAGTRPGRRPGGGHYAGRGRPAEHRRPGGILRHRSRGRRASGILRHAAGHGADRQDRHRPSLRGHGRGEHHHPPGQSPGSRPGSRAPCASTLPRFAFEDAPDKPHLQGSQPGHPARRNHGPGGHHRQRQERAAPTGPPPLRRHRRLHHHRRRGPARVLRGGTAHGGGRGLRGHHPVLEFRSGQRPAWRHGAEPGNPGGSPGRCAGTLCLFPPRRRGHADRRGRAEPFGRPAAAHRPGPGHRRQAQGAGAGRPPVRPGRQHRGTRGGPAAGGPAGDHHADRRAPAVHRGAGRPGGLLENGPDRRRRDPCGTAGATTSITAT